MDEKLTDQNKPSVEEVEFWESYYQTNVTPWDSGMASPPFKSYLESPQAVAPGKLAVLGCGKGNDCLLFATHEFEVTGFDFAPSAVAETKLKFQTAELSSNNSVVQKTSSICRITSGNLIMFLSTPVFVLLNPVDAKTIVM